MLESLCTRISISETHASTFRLLLQYIYTGKICLREVREDSILDLLGCAHKYGFVDLQHSVSDYLESILDVKNVCSIYDMASLYQLDKLENTCIRFIDRNCATLIKTPATALLSLGSDILAQIIGRDSFYASELEIFQIVKKWHEINK